MYQIYFKISEKLASKEQYDSYGAAEEASLSIDAPTTIIFDPELTD